MSAPENPPAFRWARKLLCRLLGHRQYSGWWGDGLYGNVGIGPVDNTGRTHFDVFNDCARCGQTYTLARFHGSDRIASAMLAHHYGRIEPMDYDTGPRFGHKVVAGLLGVALIAWVML